MSHEDEPPAREPSGPAAPAPEDLTYERASARVEEIIRRLDSGQAGLRETLELVRESRGLIEFCAQELAEVGRGLEELRLDDLVARLQQDAGVGLGPADARQTGSSG